MAMCPLCSERAGKRYCPAKETQICAVCCGTKREIEIDCPSSCAYLKASRSYEADKPIVEPELVAQLRKYDNSFIERHNHVLNAINAGIVEERMASPWLVDKDVIEVFKALRCNDAYAFERYLLRISSGRNSKGFAVPSIEDGH